MSLFVCDLRRLFSRKAMLALCILAPVVVMLLFASIAAPMLFSSKGLHFNLAMLQEDNSLEVRAFIYQLTHSEAMADLVTLYPVESREEGLGLVEEQKVSVLLHIPAGILDRLRQHQPVTVHLYSTPEHAFEMSLVEMTLGQSLLLVGQGQNQMETVRQVLLAQDVPQVQADAVMRSLTFEVLAQYVNRRRVLGDAGALSPLGEYLPVEYYLAAIFALFAAFAMLPLVHLTASDLSGSILKRGLACGRRHRQFFLARVLAGAVFILTVLLMILPTAGMLDLADRFFGRAYGGNLLALTATILLTSLCLSALAAALAVWAGKVQAAIWIGFYLVLGMAASGGALIPEQSLPAWLTAAGAWLPLRAALRSLACALFRFDPALYWPDTVKLLLLACIFLMLGLWGFARRERGR